MAISNILYRFPILLSISHQTRERGTYLFFPEKNSKDIPTTPQLIHFCKLPVALRPIPPALFPNYEKQISFYELRQGQKLSVPFQNLPGNKHPSVRNQWPSIVQDLQSLQTPAHVPL